MTLLWNLLIGFSGLLIISAIEDISIGCTFTWVWQGASGPFPSGCTSGTAQAQANLSNNNPTKITGS